MITLKTEVDVQDFVRGCVFMGTGGGGPQQTGLRYLMEDIKEGKELTWVDPMSIPDDAWTCVPYFMGSIAPFVPETQAKMEKKGLTEVKVDRELVNAIKGLMEYTGIEEFGGVLPMEIGGINTPAPLDAATQLGIPMIDGDYSGRAVPEIVQVSPALYDYPMTPIVSCDRWGNTLIIKEGVNNTMIEAFGKNFSVVAFVICGQAGVIMKGSDMKKCVIPGTLTKAYNIGKTIREARESGADPVQAAIAAAEGYLLFTGEVIDKAWEDKDGYLEGTVTMKGTGACEGHEFKIWYKNENHMSWLDGKPYVMSPDLIQNVDSETGEPYTNTDINIGHKISVVGMKNLTFRSEKGLSILGPRHFDFDIDYVPIEEAIK